jgi:hypothetical protein
MRESDVLLLLMHKSVINSHYRLPEFSRVNFEQEFSLKREKKVDKISSLTSIKNPIIEINPKKTHREIVETRDKGRDAHMHLE